MSSAPVPLSANRVSVPSAFNCQKAVNHVVRVEVKSGHRAVRSNAPDRYFGPSQTRKTRWRSPHEASEAFPEQCFAVQMTVSLY
jgi:hypothetical protein